MKNMTRITAMLAIAAIVGPQTAHADDPDLSLYATGGTFLASSQTVTVSFLYSLAAANNALYLFNAVASPGTFLINVPGGSGAGAPASVSFDIADYGFSMGDELIFGICTSNPNGNPAGHCMGHPTYTVYYMGPGGRNPNGAVHTAVLSPAQWNALGYGFAANTDPDTQVFGFENRGADDSPISDWDYNDIVFSVQGVNTTVPEPATMVLLATGLIGLSGAGIVRRRRNDKS